MDGRASILVSPAEGMEDLKLDLDDKDKKEALIITRDTKDILELKHLPVFHFKESEKEKILSELKELTESYLSGWTHKEQMHYLNKAVLGLTIHNSILKEALEKENIKQCLLEMILYGKYIFQYRKGLKNRESELYYINQFKEKLTFLIAEVKEVKLLMQALCDAGGIFKMLPLTYHEIAVRDEDLTEFRASEWVGHDVAYKVAKNENKFKKIIVVHVSGKIIEEYSIHEIKVLKNDTRDLGLKGLILLPLTQKNESTITIYITWAGTHSGASINADLERCPGEESFRQGEDQILKIIASIIEKQKKPVRLIICGHSLGGALSQLTFHSMQRVIALNISDEETHKKAIHFENVFHQALAKLSPHQRDISEIKINPSAIQEISVNVWNSAGVLMPVIDHTNQLGSVLSYHGIQQNAYFGLVDQDLLQSIGQGSILSQVHENGVKISILKIKYETTKTLMTLLGITGALPAGLTFFGTSPIGWAASIFCASAVLIKALSDKRLAHTKHHFKKSIRPDNTYTVYHSHEFDGSLNVDDCKIIQNELSSRSTFFVDAGLRLISYTLMQEERFMSEFKKALLLDQKKEDKQYHHSMLFLMDRLQNMVSGDEQRMIKLMNDSSLSLPVNYQDALGKTLLHYAIENHAFDFVSLLLNRPDINVNVCDKNMDFPLLSFMQKINTLLPHKVSTYQLGDKLLSMTTMDLFLKNEKGHSVQTIYKSWYWKGFNAKCFTKSLADRLNQSTVFLLEKERGVGISEKDGIPKPT